MIPGPRYPLRAMKAARRLLVVDDEENWQDLLSAWLEAAGYALARAFTGREALKAAREAPPDAVLLDYGLPDITGLEVCRQLRALPATRSIPIVIISAQTKEKVALLQGGADYFVPKSENPAELMAVLEAVFRRRDMDRGVLSLGDLTLDPGTRSVLVKDQPAAVLTPKLFELFRTLVLRSPEPLSREELFRLLEGSDDMGASRALDILLNRLRKALPEDLAGRIKNVKGFGYLYLPPKK